MKEINDKISKNIKIESDTILYGMVVGNIEITNSAKLIVHGMVTGTISNYGQCEIFGVINGEIIDYSNQTYIDSKAIIQK